MRFRKYAGKHTGAASLHDQPNQFVKRRAANGAYGGYRRRHYHQYQSTNNFSCQSSNHCREREQQAGRRLPPRTKGNTSAYNHRQSDRG